MRVIVSSSTHGTNSSVSGLLYFQAADGLRSLDYTVVTYRSGVAVRADAQVLWAPVRSPADAVPASVTAVDVLVVRNNLHVQRQRGAPTVARTLTGAPARALADFVNHLPRATPAEHVSCPASLGGVRWFDRLTFHGTGPDATLLVNLTDCARSSATLQVGHHKPIQLAATPVDVHDVIDRTITASIGLPDHYGEHTSD